MTNSPIYNFAHLQPRAGSPEVPINEWMDGSEGAQNRRVEWDAGTKTLLTQDDLASALIHVFTGNLSGQVELFVAGLNEDDEPLERFFIIENATTENIIVSISGQSGLSVVVPPTFAEALHTDGVNVRIITFNTTVLSTEGGGGGGLSFSAVKVKKSADQTGANYTGGAVISFDAEIYDTDDYHDNSVNPSRLIAPVTGYYTISAALYITNMTAGTWLTIQLRKNGSLDFDGTSAQRAEVGALTHIPSFCADAVPLNAGDYVELWMQPESDTSIDVIADKTNFGMRRVG